MSTPSPHALDPVRAARELRLALVALSDGLANGRLDAVLDVEPRLATAAAGIRAAAATAMTGLTPRRRGELRTELGGACAAMTSCALLGRSLDDMVRARCSTGYRPWGSGTVPPVQPSIVELA